LSPHSAVFRPENNGVLTKRAFCTIILSYAPRICLWFLRKKGGTPVKRIKIPAMLLALALTLTACAAGQKTFQRGSVEGRTYTSEFLGLTCTAPEEFAYLSDQEIAEMNSITLESGEDLASAMKQRLEDGGQVQDMYLMTEDALHRVGVTVDKVTDGKTAVDMAAFIENGIAQAEEYYAAIEGMTDVGAAAQTTKFLGGEYDSILTTATYNGFPTQSLQVCIPLEQYICVVTFTSYVEDRTDEMMGFFSTIAASK
jgi:hypothetical protein